MSCVPDPVARAAWHPVALAGNLDPGKPHPVVVLGEELVLWRGRSDWHAWQDLCVHRGVRLSLGRLTKDCFLRCAYHGWTYDEGGRCVHMPAHPTIKPPSRAQAKVFACREVAGLLWVSLEAPSGEPGGLPEAGDSAFRAVSCGPYPAPAGAPRLMENFLDVAHLPIVHEGALGVADRAEIAPYDVDWVDGRPVAKDIRIYQPNPEGLSHAGEVSYEYGVLAPFTVYLRKHLPDGRRFSLLFAVTPLTETASIAWFTIFLNYGDPAQDAAIAAFQNQIFAQDLPVVASQRPEKLPLDLAEELHLPSDRLAIAYRQYIRRLGLTFGTA